MESLDSILADLQHKHNSVSNDPVILNIDQEAKSRHQENQDQSAQIDLDSLCPESSYQSRGMQDLDNQAIAPQSKSSTNSLDNLLESLKHGADQSTPVKPTPIQAVDTVQSIDAVNKISQELPKELPKELQQVADRQKHQSQQEQQAIAKQAQAWLKKLDPLSGEGLWFEEFAKNYPSKLEAAIALLSS